MAKSVSIPSGQSPDQIEQVFRNIQATLSDQLLTTATLGIATTTSKVRTSAAAYSVNDGALVLKASTDNLFTLAGSVTNAKFNVYVLTLTAAGGATARMGTEGATIGALLFPAIPAGEVVIGFVIINPTGSGNFVGGTTALTDATVVPNAVYVNTPFPFNPNLVTLPNYN
jgi:hypothetical protein